MYFLLKKQIGHEMENSHAYKNIYSRLKFEGLNNLANYFLDQANHEMEHVELLIDYLADRNEVVSIPMINEINFDNKSIKEIMDFYLNKEKEITQSIEKILDFAETEEKKDRLTIKFLYEFAFEQVEEEASAQNLYDQVIPMIEDKKFLIILDAELEGDYY